MEYVSLRSAWTQCFLTEVGIKLFRPGVLCLSHHYQPFTSPGRQNLLLNHNVMSVIPRGAGCWKVSSLPISSVSMPTTDLSRLEAEPRAWCLWKRKRTNLPLSGLCVRGVGLTTHSSLACPALLQPAGSAGSAVTTPPPLVRGTQNIPSGKPSLQVSVPTVLGS